MPEELQYILMPASVLGLFKKEMLKTGVKIDTAKLALIKLGYLTAQETTKGEERSSDFESFRSDLAGRLKSQGLGQLLSVITDKGGDIRIIMDRSIESRVNGQMSITGKCSYMSGYLMGLVNTLVPVQRQYICREIACVNEGTGKNCIFELKPKSG